MTSRPGGWAISGRTLVLSMLVVIVLAAALGIGMLLGGVPAAIAILMGCLASIRPATVLPPAQALALAVPAAMTAAVALAIRAEPFAAASFVALVCLLVAPANILIDGLLAAVPTVAAVMVSFPGEFDLLTTAGWMLFGSGTVVLVASRLGRSPRPAGVGEATAWRHAIVMALSVGLVTYLVTLLEVPHGFWIALTLTVVLRPYGKETVRKAGQRVSGTIGGVLLALVLAALLPLWAAQALVLVCLVLMIAYAAVGDYVRQVVFMTPAVVLLGGAPEVLAVERAASTLVGALLAGALALGLAWWERRHLITPEVGP